MKKQNKVIKPNVVRGGVAIPLGNNFYFMSGRKHEQGGIDIGPNNNNGLEVEGGEVMQMGGKHVKVYSSLPILNGKSPAELVIAGLDPSKVFNAQERFKDINRLNDDGSRKARFGKRKKAEVGAMWIEDEFGNIIENDEPIIPEPFSYDNPIKGPIKDMAYRIMTQMPGADRNMSHVREAVNHHIYKKPVPLHYTGGASPEMERDDEYATWDNPKRNLAKLYLTGESGDIEQISDNSRGFDYTNYLKKNKYKAKTYRGEILPDEVIIPKGYEYVINNMETSGKSVNAYNHDNEFDDVANHKQQIGRDEKGNLEIQASDVWDFQPNDYAKLWKGKFKIKPYIQASMLNTIGNPFILRDYSKIKFTDNENDVKVPNSVKHWLYEYPIKKENVDGMPHYSLENNEIEMIFDKHNINKKPLVHTNTQTYKPERKRLGGFNRHFIINGNIMNKAGYVPSTGELPKANLGTIASIDKHVTRKDKDGRVASALKADTQKQIDTYNTSKKYRDAKSAEIKRKTLFDREQEISRNPNEYDKIENDIDSTNNKVIVVKPTLFKPETKEKTNNEGYIMKSTDTKKNGILAYKDKNNKSIKKEKNKTNTNNLNINSLYPNRFGNLTNPTIKLEGNDVPLSALPQLAVEAINRKLKFSSKKDVDPESKGLNIPETEIINKGVTSKINLDTIPKIDIEKPIVEKYPANITGDTIMYTGPSNMGGRRYYLPQSIDLSSVKGGYRNRGDYRDIETQGLVLPTMHEFYRFGDLNQETIKLLQSNDPNNLKGLIGLDKEGNIKVGRFGDFNEDDIVSVVSYDNIRGFNKNNDGSIKWAPRSDRWSDKYVFTETTSINPITGKDETGSINVGGSRANPTDKAYGFLNGGHVVIKAGDEVRLISGSVSDIDKEIEKMKIRNNVDNVEFFMLDNGTYNLGLRTTDGVLKASDLKRYDNQNTAGGHGIYLKRFGGVSKRQKAKGGKDIFSPRGLGIQATMAKMQADAWDKEHPGEDNPFAQQFIDDFVDPTIYSSIMSDGANARRIGIDRGYKGNIGLGFNMPELPNINLDNYFSAQGNLIAGTDRSGGGLSRSGSGASGGRRPEIKIEPLKLSAMQIKPKGVTVDPVKTPTQITIKTPEIETKNKGTWWKDNGSDLISGIAKGGASLASYLINRNMLNDLKYQGQPIFTPAAKLKTKININPQIDAVNRTTAARNANVSANTASSKVRNARMNNNYIDRLGYLNELYGMKENKETELINANKLNQQEITKGNIKAYNDWVEKKQNFENTVREKQSENAVSFVSNLASGVDDILTNRQKRKQFKQNVAAYMASHPNVSPELLESYGLDIFGNTKKKKSNTSKKINIRIPTKEEIDLMKTVRKLNEEKARLNKTK